MKNKFALIKFAENMAKISVKHEIIRKAPEKIFNWYIEKLLPYSLKEIEICTSAGYEIILPMLNGDNAALLEKIMEKVEADCYDLGVRAVIADNGIAISENFFVPDGNIVKAFFVKVIMEKYLKSAEIDAANGSVIIIEGNEDETMALARFIYGGVNHLGIIVEEGNQADYEEFADEVFDDCGLMLNFGRRGSYLLKEADIIINLSKATKGYESFYKKGACYIELSASDEKLKSFLSKREGVLTVDKFSVEYAGNRLSLAQFELISFLTSPDFTRYANSKFNSKYFEQTAKSIEKQNIKIRNLNM